jgi:hypothetical protein
MASVEDDGSLFKVIGDYRDSRAVEIMKEVAKVYYPEYENYYTEFDEHVKYGADYWKTHPGHALERIVCQLFKSVQLRMVN